VIRSASLDLLGRDHLSRGTAPTGLDGDPTLADLVRGSGLATRRDLPPLSPPKPRSE
jgi:hypothetical protein